MPTGNELTIGFIGNPNCGKTTLFNAYTGANLKVANWPGVTVEKVEGAIKDHDQTIRLVDLPGTYSLTSYTMEEIVSRQFILSDEVDVIINVVDASALERSLYLTLQLLELKKPVVLALNMMDIVQKRGMEIDLHRLPEMLGIPVIPVSARKRMRLDILIHTAIHHKDVKGPEILIHNHRETDSRLKKLHSEYAMVYSDDIEEKIADVTKSLSQQYPELINKRWYAIKLLEGDREISEKYPVKLPDMPEGNCEAEIINQKYDFIDEIIHEVMIHKQRQDKFTEKLDRAFTHRMWGIPIFLGIMAQSHILFGEILSFQLSREGGAVHPPAVFHPFTFHAVLPEIRIFDEPGLPEIVMNPSGHLCGDPVGHALQRLSGFHAFFLDGHIGPVCFQFPGKP